jgi:hypothetical protein
LLKDLKLKAVVGSLAVALIATPDATAAFSLSGKLCKKAGKISISEGTTYICKKNKKKLLWQVKEAAPPKTILLPTSFDDLGNRVEGSYVSAWNSFNNKNLNSKPIEVNQKILVGPDSTLINNNVTNSFIQATRLFDGFKQPDSFTAIYYKYEDKAWAKEKLKELGFESRSTEVDTGCPSTNHCNGATAGKADGNTGLVQFGIPRTNEQDIYHLNGAIEIHEYAHLVQFMQFVGKPAEDRNLGYLPSWFIEGHAHAVSNLGSSKSLEGYKVIRSHWLNTSPNQEIKSFQPQDIERFYDELMPFKGNPEMFGYVYTLGYITIEALMSLKGFDSPSNLILEVSNGESFESAFLKVYGITWASAKPILAQVVSKQFLGK